MKELIIVGAGSVGVEVYNAVLWINDIAKEKTGEPEYEILGFIDDAYATGKRFVLDNVPVIGTIEDWEPRGQEVYAMAMATPKTKEIVATKLQARGCEFISVILPNAMVSPSVKIGKGCYIASFRLSGESVVGDFVNIQGSMVGGTAVIGDYSTTLGFANIANGRLGKRVYVGSQAVVLDVSVGDDATVCVGSIVVKNVKPGTKVFGYPAKRVDW